MTRPDTPFKLWSLAGDLNHSLIGSVIENVMVSTERQIKGIYPDCLVGWSFSSIETHGKCLVFKFENIGIGTYFMASRLGNGHWKIREESDFLNRCFDAIYIIFTISHPNKKKYQVVFSDRKYDGFIEISKNIHELGLLNLYGPAIDSPYFTIEWVKFVFFVTLKNPNANRFSPILLHLLIRQKYFAGISKRLVSEICFLANVFPEIKIRDITERQTERIYHSILIVFANFSKSFKESDFFVYKKTICSVCSSKIVRVSEARIKVVYFYCPTCQAKDYKEPEPVSAEFVGNVVASLEDSNAK